VKFYCIVNTGWSNSEDRTTLKLLQEACEKKGLDFILVDSRNFDFTQQPKLKKGDLLYKVSYDSKSSMVFRILADPGVSTVYSNFQATISRRVTSALTHQKIGLPIIRTIFDLPTDPKVLKKYVDYLGGFPIIIKAVGTSHGAGVMRVDSFQSLASLVGFLRSTDGKFIMRQYLDFEQHARLIVVDNKVVDSAIYEKPTEDFRTNVKNIKIMPHKFSKEVEKIAIDSVKVLSSDFGGVDILIDKKGTPFLAEVNIPCYFPRLQLATGVDIAGSIIDMLVKKSSNEKNNRRI
jgi:RimK family alpha-L-glutamate ligase